jgi:hypothetical protein
MYGGADKGVAVADFFAQFYLLSHGDKRLTGNPQMLNKRKNHLTFDTGKQHFYGHIFRVFFLFVGVNPPSECESHNGI